MCLITKKNIPNVAENDITVYKLVEYYDKKTDRFYPLVYKGIFYEIGREAVPSASEYEPFQCSQNLKPVFGFNGYNIEGGAIHAGLNFESLFPLIKSIMPSKMSTGLGFAILRCVVPKGTRYFAGENGDIASEKIIPQEVMVDFGMLSFCICRYNRIYIEPILVCDVVNETGQKAFKLFHDNTFEVYGDIVENGK